MNPAHRSRPTARDTKAPRPIKILSIDGGGIRGIIPAVVLTEIEKRTKKPIAKMFDLIAGTSTGGILTMALTRPGARGKPKYSAKEVLDIYVKEGKQIFSRSIWHRIHAAGNLLEEKYPSKGLESVLTKYLGKTRLKDSLTETLVTAYEIEQRKPWFFKRHKARKTPRQHDFAMAQVAHATSAAPTFFEPLKIPLRGTSDYLAMIDGGVYANNPAMCAFVEARKLHPNNENWLVVSLGTGELTRSLPFDHVKGWGLSNWAQPILSVVFDGISDTTDHQLRTLLPRNRYYRFQTQLTKKSQDMDDASAQNIARLKSFGTRIVRTKSGQIDKLCEALSR